MSRGRARRVQQSIIIIKATAFGRSRGTRKKTAPAHRRGRSNKLAGRLLARGAELGRHVRERVAQLTAEGVDRGDDRNGDAGRDEAVFDRGRSALVAQKTLDGHDALPRLSAFCRRDFTSYGGQIERNGKKVREVFAEK